MSARGRLAVWVLVAALAVAGALAWWQWPVAGPDPAAQARAARIEELRAAIARERAALEAARETRERTDAELEALRESIERQGEQIENLRRQAEQARDGT